MSGTTTVILGGGWGGMTLAHRLAAEVGDEHRIVVVDHSPTFSLGVSNLSVLTGAKPAAAVTRDMAKLKNRRIEWVHARVTSIDPVGKRVETTSGALEGDYLVLALGAELAPGLVPGFAEAADDVYEVGGAATANQALREFVGGKIVVLVAGAPFRCPAAPYEVAMLVEAWIREHGSKDRVEIDLYTPESIPMAVAGPVVGQGLVSFLEDRGIGVHFNRQVDRVDPESHTIHIGDLAVTYDLLLGVPPHRPPAALDGAGLAGSGGYVPVHPQTLEILTDADTLEVGYPGVFAIGDIAAVRLMNSMMLPKAGVFAEGQANVVAAAIAADINGLPRPGPYEGHGFCYVSVGDGLAAYGDGNFYAYPEPRVTLHEPSEQSNRAKAEYETVLDDWFGA